MRATKSSKPARIFKRPVGRRLSESISSASYSLLPLLVTAFLTALISASAIAFFYHDGSLMNFGDAESHLNIARRVLDSRTPGYDQLGTTWLPLPHILFALFARNNRLWTTGLAGSIPSALCFVSAACFFFAAVRRIFDDLSAAVVAAALFVLNPNALYLQSTAMTEPLFFACLFGLLYFCVLFQQSQSTAAAAAAGLFAAFGALTRYEGWILLPFAAAFFLVVARRKWNFILFSAVAAAGPLLWIAYNWWVFDNALDFYNGSSSAKAIQHGLPYPGKNNWGVALLYFRTAAELGTGSPLFWIGVAGLGACAVQFRRSLWPALLLALLPAFYILSVHSSDTPIHVPSLPPHSWYNTRYGLSLLPLAAFGGGALVALMPRSLRPGVGALVLLAGSGQWAFFPRPPSWIVWREAEANSETRLNWTQQAASYLAERYRPGESIFTTPGDINGIYRRLRIPLRYTMSIDNGPIYKATIARPDLFLWATWVVCAAGDPVQTAVDRARLHGPKYELAKQIAVKGGPVIQIYRRPSVPLGRPR